MKFTSSNDPNAIFYEQVETVSDFFEKWSECQRTVVIYALLKRLPYPCLKFMQSTIEAIFAQCNCIEQIQLIEQHSNSKIYLTELCDSYKNLTNTINDVQLNRDSILYNESDINLVLGDTITNVKNNNNNNNNNSNSNNNNNTNHTNNTNLDKLNKKDDILNDILNYIPMLRIGNDEAKLVYLSLIPFMVDDTRRGIVSDVIVQQILSFLLIHPALTTDDRRSLNPYIRYFGDHIVNRNQTEQSINNSWQTIAPPATLQSSSSLSSTTSSQKLHQLHLISNENLWDTQSVHLSQDFIDNDGCNSSGNDLFKSIGQNNDFKSSSAIGSNCSSNTNNNNQLFESSNDDHHVSFSKNGTEILDFDPDSEQSNTHIAFSTISALNDFLTIPILMDNVAIKTRRSNSLTTGTKQHEQLTATFTSSSENLTNMVYKPRSFSLSMESPRSSVTSSGSETRLDDFKPSYQTFQTQHIGMSGMAQWLKSLRLHKYVWIFSSMSYEQMLNITEEYLSKLEVTKGARHKLVLCIQKLKERYSTLVQVEKSLLNGPNSIFSALEEMTNIVITPMKPIEMYNKEDVASQFLKVLDIVCNMLTTKQIVPQDEDSVNSLLWILEKAVHNEAFVTHANQLKENRFKISKLKMKFPPKGHYNKNGNSASNGNSNKMRWSSGTKTHKGGHDSKSHRKNSNPMPNFNFNSSQQHQPQSHQQSNSQMNQNKQTYSISSNTYSTSPSSSSSVMCYNKSSSFPNFNSNGNMSGHHFSHNNTYHRHSVSNLITITPSQTTSTIVTPSAPISHKQPKNQQQQNPIDLLPAAVTTKTTCSSIQSLRPVSNSVGINNSNNNSNNNNGNPTSITASVTVAAVTTNASKLNPYNNARSSSSGSASSTSNGKHVNTRNTVGDINSRLEFLCLQMTEQAIN